MNHSNRKNSTRNGQPRVALYSRVSTADRQHPENQIAELREHAERRGWKVVEEFTDRMSGGKDSRPALNRLMEAAHRREFDVIAVTKLDRFGRSLKHLVTSLAEFDALGIAFVSLRDNFDFDLSTPSGRLLFQLVGAMAEFERALTVERVRVGLQHAVARGVRLGRPFKVVNVVRIKRLRQKGVPWKKVAASEHCAIMTAMAALNGRSKKPAVN